MAPINPNEALKLAKAALDRAQEVERNNKAFMAAIGPALISALSPLLEQLKTAVSGLKVDVKPNVTVEPNVHLPAINVSVPEIRVPKPEVTVNVPAANITIPDIKIPDVNIKYPDTMDIRGWIGLMGYDKGLLSNPLPVQIRDAKGNPIDFSALGSNVLDGGGSGGGGNFPMNVYDASTSALRITGSVSISANATQASVLQNTEGTAYNSDNPLPVTFSAASVQPVSQVSGANWSVNVAGFTATVFVLAGNSEGIGYNSDNPLPVTFASSVQPVSQVSGNNWSVFATNPVDQGDAATALRVVIAGNSDTSVVVNSGTLTAITNTVTVQQVSGAIWSTYLQNPFGPGDEATALRVLIAGDSVASVVVNNPQGPGEQATSLRVVVAGDSDTSVYVRNPVAQGDAATALRVVIAGNSDVSVSATQVGTWTVALSGALTSAVVVGPVVADAADDGSAPIQQGGIARTANPTAVAANDVVKATFDDLGRQITRPVQVRDLIKTAYVSVTGGTETTLRAAVAGAYLDLVMVVASNNSDAAVSVDIRAVTAGNILHTLRVPANGTAGWAPQVPWPQDETGNNWTVDGPDETGRTLTFSALFSQEI